MFPDAGTKPLVGVIHLPRLVGEPGTDIDAVLARVETDAGAYRDAGFDAVLVENYGDAPFPKEHSEPHVAAVMARAVEVARRVSGFPTGCNVLRNDARSALAACLAGGGSFVRVNVLAGAYVTDQGLIEGDARGVRDYRAAIGGDAIKVFADVRVKHAAPLVERPIAEEADELVFRAGADGLLVTGKGTGQAIDLDAARVVSDTVAGRVPVWAASGCTADNVGAVLEVLDGAIIGTAAKEGGDVRARVDVRRAAALVEAANVVRSV